MKVAADHAYIKQSFGHIPFFQEKPDHGHCTLHQSPLTQSSKNSCGQMLACISAISWTVAAEGEAPLYPKDILAP